MWLKLRFALGLILVMTAAFAVTPPSAHALCLTQDMNGVWMNDNPATRGITKIQIHFPCYDTSSPPAGSPVAYTHVFKDCYPIDCNWGWASTRRVTRASEAPHFTSLVSNYDGDDVRRIIKFRLQRDGRLSAVMTTYYTDGRSWPSVSGTEVFHRESPIATDPLARTRELTLRVTHLHATSDDACGSMDFYGTLGIGERHARGFGVVEGNDVDPGWAIGMTTSGWPMEDAVLDIRDDDDAFCGGSDDAVDVNPDPAQTAIRVRMDVVTRAIHIVNRDTSLGRIVGSAGRPITLAGAHGSETGAVTFQIEVATR